MDILDQVDKVLKDMESRERRTQTARRLFEGSVLAELSKQYNQYVNERRWEQAHECLMEISRLVVGMLSR